MKPSARNALGKPSRRTLALFDLYLQWYLPRHFHGLRIVNAERLPRDADRPIVIFLNHASWWDPLTCVILARRFLRDFDHYAPMDEVALAQYGFFRKLGMFPVEKKTTRGAIQLLRAAEDIFSRKSSVLWLTPEGEFRDPRRHVPRFENGLATLLSRSPDVNVVPIAIEYVFWDERLPEILVNCGNAIQIADCDKSSVASITATCANALAVTQEELAALAILRDPLCFETLLAGGSGVGFFYDMWRRVRSAARGEKYQPEHGGLRRL